MKIVYPLDGDTTVPVVAVTTPGADVASLVVSMIGEGNPYYCFTTIPFDFSNGINADFTGAPDVDADPAVNGPAIIAMLETPPLSKISAP